METNSSDQAFVSLKRNRETELSALNLISKLEKCYLCFNSNTVKKFGSYKDSVQDSSCLKSENFPASLVKLHKKYPNFSNISPALYILFKEGENCRETIKNNSPSIIPWCSPCFDSLLEIAKLQGQIAESEEKIGTLISQLIASRGRNINSFRIHQEGDDQEPKGNDVPTNSPSSVPKDIVCKTEIEDFYEEFLQEFSPTLPTSPGVPSHGHDIDTDDDERVAENGEKYSSSDDNSDDSRRKGSFHRKTKKMAKKRGRRRKYNVDLSSVDKNNPVCPYCMGSFNSMKSISEHILRKHLKIKRHTCSECDKQFFTRGEWRRHNRTWHSSGLEEEGEEKAKLGKSFPCSKCGKSFTSHRNCIAHQVISCKIEVDPEILDKLNMTFYHCEWDNCSALFHREKDLSRHSITHTGKKVACPQCGKSFSREDTLKKHAESYCDKRTKINELDRVSVKKRPLLKRPRPKTPKESMLKCPKCPRRFALQKTLDLHLTRHPTTGVKETSKSICHLCGKLMNDYQIPVHVKQVHEKKLKFFCNYCQKGFFTKLNRNAHIKSIHERDEDAPRPEKRIQCDQCSNMFLTVGGLNDHIRRVHFKITKYNCKVCDMKFYHKNDLRKHNQKHGRSGKISILSDGTDNSI